MTVHPVTPISPDRLKRMRWKGKRDYRLLSYGVSLRSNRTGIAERADDALGAFAVDPSGSPNGDVFRLVDLGPSEPLRYRLLRDDEQLIGSGVLVDVIHQFMWQAMRGMMQQTKDLMLIHAGAVVAPGGKAILFPADPGSGKTTLVTGLVRAGFGFLSDEVGVIEPGTARLHPFPRALNLKNGTLEIFPDLHLPSDDLKGALRRRFVKVGEIRPKSEAGPTEVAFIIAPRYREGARTEVTVLSAAETTKELWANAMNRSLHGPRALPILAYVAARAKGYRLVSGNLQDALKAVAELTGVPTRSLQGS
jgi:hypothetical protein